MRMPNSKRVTVIELGQFITPAPGKSTYLQEEEIWMDDPVHFTPKGYSLAAADTRRGQRRRRTSPEAGRPGRGQQSDPNRT